jgi:hypothetical protein
LLRSSRCVPSVCFESDAGKCQTATEKCKQALKKSAENYEQLFAMYKALENIVPARMANQGHAREAEEDRGYVLVLIDAHSDKVCFACVYTD